MNYENYELLDIHHAQLVVKVLDENNYSQGRVERAIDQLAWQEKLAETGLEKHQFDADSVITALMKAGFRKETARQVSEDVLERHDDKVPIQQKVDEAEFTTFTDAEEFEGEINEKS